MADTPLLLVVAMVLALSACGRLAAGEGPAAEEPPEDPAEGVVEEPIDEGRAAAELAAEPAAVVPGEPVELTIVNHGDVELSYGRPITVERWDGEAWAETDESRETVWTMELLLLPPGGTGEPQIWPFTADHTPDAGWYRFTKLVRAEGVEGDVDLTVRARVQVRE